MIERGPQWSDVVAGLEGPLHHASPALLRKGATIEPTNVAWGEPLAWATGFESAVGYAERHAQGVTGSGRTKRRGPGHVYEVEPLDPDEEPVQKQQGSDEWASRKGFRVVRRVRGAV